MRLNLHEFRDVPGAGEIFAVREQLGDEVRETWYAKDTAGVRLLGYAQGASPGIGACRAYGFVNGGFLYPALAETYPVSEPVACSSWPLAFSRLDLPIALRSWREIKDRR